MRSHDRAFICQHIKNPTMTSVRGISYGHHAGVQEVSNLQRRHCSRRQPTVGEAEVAPPVQTLKGYLERVGADAKAIHELEIGEHLLCTSEGVRWVMPQVISA